MIADPILDLEGKHILAILSDGERIKGRLVSYRGDVLTVQSNYPRPRRVLINKYEVKTIELDPRKRRVSTPADRRRSAAFWR